MTKDHGGPAFPVERGSDWAKGMTLRDYFAGQALAGMMFNRDALDYNPAGISACCYQLADAMLAERSKNDA